MLIKHAKALDISVLKCYNILNYKCIGYVHYERGNIK